MDKKNTSQSRPHKLQTQVINTSTVVNRGKVKGYGHSRSNRTIAFIVLIPNLPTLIINLHHHVIQSGFRTEFRLNALISVLIEGFVKWPRRKWEDNIRMDLEEIGINVGNWVDSAQDEDYWRALVYVYAALNLRVP